MTHFSLTEVTAPAVEPLGLAQAKDHLRVTHDREDAQIDALVLGARQIAEDMTGRAFMTQTWDLALDRFPAEIRVPKPPLLSVTSITYIDAQGTPTVLDAADYQVDTGSTPGRIKPAFGLTWPQIRLDYGAVVVRFVAGYGAGVGLVPMPVKQAMLLILAELYQRREEAIVGAAVNPVPWNAEALLARYRVEWL